MDRAACAQVIWPWRHCLCAKQMWQRGLHVTMDSSFEEMLVGRFCQGRHAIRLGSAADWKRGFDSPLGNFFFSCLLSSSFREDSVLNLETTHDLKKNEHKNETRRVNFWMHDQLKKICYVVVVLFKNIFISQCSTGCFSNFRLTWQNRAHHKFIFSQKVCVLICNCSVEFDFGSQALIRAFLLVLLQGTFSLTKFNNSNFHFNWEIKGHRPISLQELCATLFLFTLCFTYFFFLCSWKYV